MKLNSERSDNVLYGNYNYVFFRTFNNEKLIEVAIWSKNFARYATLSLTPTHSFSLLLM